MKSILVQVIVGALVITISLALMPGCAPKKQVLTEGKALFNGTSFDGWEGNLDYFRIEEEAIVAGTLEDNIPHNEFLCTETVYEDFELRLEAKMVGAGDNAGIQFRSKRIADHHEVYGYQCDMGSDPGGKIWGYLYDESRRKKFIAQPQRSEMMKVLNVNDWNEFVIRVEGDRIQIWLNGFKTVDYIEEDESIARSGVICLQIHGGKPAEAWYKDLVITEL